MILFMMIPQIRKPTVKIFQNVKHIAKQVKEDNNESINLKKQFIETFFTNIPKDMIENTQIDEFPQELLLSIQKPIDVKFIIDDNNKFTVKNIMLKGIIKKYSDHIYLIEQPKKIHQENLIIDVNNTQLLISTMQELQNILFNDHGAQFWRIAFSSQGFILFNTNISEKANEITNIETYTNSTNILAILENENIKYYNIKEAFPEIKNQINDFIIGGAIIFIVGGVVFTNTDSPVTEDNINYTEEEQKVEPSFPIF